MDDQKKGKEKYKAQLEEALEELKTPGKRHRQIPNILTASRLLAPLLIIPSAITGNLPLTIGLAAGFGLTDMVDGAIARKFNLQSELGATLDAVTDKVYVGTLLIASAIFNPILIVNILLELVIANININEELNGKKAESTMIGKIKTWFLFILAGVGLLGSRLNLNTIISTLAGITGLMQFLTVDSYIKKYKKSKDDNDDKLNVYKEAEEDTTEDQQEDQYEYIKGKETIEVKDINLTTSEKIEELKKLKEFLTDEQLTREAKQYQKKHEG